MITQVVNNSIAVNDYSRHYPAVNKYVMENGDSIESRNGHTREILNFKTELHNPYCRLIGNHGRNMNVFFLLAEAIWIVKGERDVDFLSRFNSRMKNYSDDGEVFHAPYGFRLRHYGVDSYNKMISTSPENNGHAVQQMLYGEDQVLEVLKILRANASDRRAVMSIWNTELDLGTKSKDIPCNDLVMMKIRNNELHTTIANRSNDLHWGLTTNIFQFSFLSEVMANILDVELGTQTHNSQSLHIYTEESVSIDMYDSIQLNSDGRFEDLYDRYQPMRMDMRFATENVEGRLAEVDHYLAVIITALKEGRMPNEKYSDLKSFSQYLCLVYDLLNIYQNYKNEPVKNDEVRWGYFSQIGELSMYFPNLDLIAMAGNFFATRIEDEVMRTQIIQPLGNL